MKHNFSQFELGYIECMLCSSVDENEEPMDSNYSIEDLSDEAIQQIKKDCDLFIKKAGNLLDSLDDSQSGHDFWLTRNHHGAGFWDRGLGELGEKLTDLSDSFGEAYLYVGDDGELYI